MPQSIKIPERLIEISGLCEYDSMSYLSRIICLVPHYELSSIIFDRQYKADKYLKKFLQLQGINPKSIPSPSVITNQRNLARFKYNFESSISVLITITL